jgi:hypothetical protein
MTPEGVHYLILSLSCFDRLSMRTSSNYLILSLSKDEGGPFWKARARR